MGLTTKRAIYVRSIAASIKLLCEGGGLSSSFTNISHHGCLLRHIRRVHWAEIYLYPKLFNLSSLVTPQRPRFFLYKFDTI